MILRFDDSYVFVTPYEFNVYNVCYGVKFSEIVQTVMYYIYKCLQVVFYGVKHEACHIYRNSLQMQVFRDKKYGV